MASIIGNAIVVIALGVVIFFAGRRTIRSFKAELKGECCCGCSGGSCAGCSKCNTADKQVMAK